MTLLSGQRTLNDPTGAKGTFAPLKKPNSLVLFGNSIISNAGGPGAHTGSQTIYDSKGWTEWMNILLGNRFRLITNSGAAGSTTANMLSRIQADVLDHDPDYVLCEEVTNDVGSGVSVATQQANWQSIWSQLRAAGITIIQVTAPPRTGLTTGQMQDLQAMNRWFRDQARSYGLILLDIGDAIVDPSASTYTSDAGLTVAGVHPNSPGAAKMGLIAARTLDPLIPVSGILTVGPGAAGADELLSNPWLYGTGATAPAGWSTSGTPTISYVPRSDGIAPDWCQMVVGAGAGASLTSNITVDGSTLSVGDEVYFAVEVDADSLEASPAANTQAFYAFVQFWNGSSWLATKAYSAYWDTSYVNVPFPGVGQSFRTPPVFCTPPVTVPTGTQIVQAVISGSGGGNYRAGRATLRKGTPN